jgi:hypothetical protein
MTATMNQPAPAIPRDRWGRPLITPVGGGKPIGYTRVSTLAKAIDDTEGLTQWKLRQAIIGLTRRSDLISLAASKTDDKATLNRVAKEALDAADSGAAANTGTALHSFTETADLGGDLSRVPHEHRPDIDAYLAATSSLTVLAMEQFVVIDELQAAGSFDRIYRMPDGRIVIGDLKTGASAPNYAQATAAQMAMYAHGALYEFATGTRHPLTMVDKSIALMIHLPAGTGTCDIYVIDIAAGWEAALLASKVRDWRKAKPATLWSAP